MRSPLGRRALLAAGLAPAALFSLAAPAWAGPPPATCGGGAPGIADAVGDGHHLNTDVTAAWLTETGGRLQAVIQVDQAAWEPAHDDSDAAAFALLFGVNGAAGPTTRYVRALAGRGGSLRFDHGTWTRAGGFATQGPTTGETSVGGRGAVTIDVPTAPGIARGAVLARPFALTADGGTPADPHWVDAAPGGTSPETAGAGADYTVGACSAAGGPTVPGPIGGGPPASTPGGPAAPAPLTGVSLEAPPRITGAKTVTLRGAVAPARAGVAVQIAATTRGGTRTLTATTGADGRFALASKVGERTTWRAQAGGLGSGTSTTQVRARITVTARRTAAGGLVVRGTVSPRLPGRVLWLRSDAVSPSATTTPSKGRFTLRLAHPRPGRYQALFIPSKARAERALSRSESIR